MSVHKKILIISGEPSGDARGAELVRELKHLTPSARFTGIGGARMKEEGVRLIDHIRNFSIVGVWEIFQNLPRIHEQFKSIIRHVREERPDLAILIDYPGFNLRLAKALKKERIPVVYYIIPQVWAWGIGRVKKIKRYVDKALVIFAFEKRFLDKYGIASEFVGHPLADMTDGTPETKDERRRTKDATTTIALLPGSREHEIRRILPIMLDAAEKISAKKNNVVFILAENSNVAAPLYVSALERYRRLPLFRLKDDTFKALGECDFAMVASGTATLETAVAGKPMIIAYSTSFFTYILARMFMKVRSVGLVNILLGKEAVPELLQADLTGEKLSLKTLEIISDSRRMEEMKKDLAKVRNSLGEKGAAKRAAEAVARFLLATSG
jgi:lipid-A-disaccharide synthase